ncbi:hypothetical protein [Desulfosarcina cetonica]|uniref:hypothetical protein n=1 Tax=Desulfosarcina cetonica TaxID=90730 RepID=UPI0012ECC4BB|nr:hypothetical protein [Desulfosarcina cetonica]
MDTLLLNGMLALLAGSLLNFMPCVLPVIPFKIQAILKTTNGSMAARSNRRWH